MNGYRVCIYKLTDRENQEKYNREDQEQIFEQKVTSLDVRAVIAIVNGLPVERMAEPVYLKDGHVDTGRAIG